MNASGKTTFAATATMNTGGKERDVIVYSITV